VHEITAFGTIVLIVGAAFVLAVLASKLTSYVPVPAPAIFLLAAAVASDVFPHLRDELSIETVERVGVVALILILFDGGMHVGWRRFRASVVPIGVLGVAGTFATALIIAVAAHALFDFSWTTAGIVGAALAPTDPAVMFAVLGRREIRGRSGTILEGESGANDPVGIALMIGMLDIASHGGDVTIGVVGDFALQMAVGLLAGYLGARVLLPFMRTSLPHEGLYPLRTLAVSLAIYGAATVAHGSGFLAVFVTGILVGDARAPYKAEIEGFHRALASLAEITVFVALGLTIDLSDVFSGSDWLKALALGVVLALIARPLVAGPLLLPVRLRWGERLFIMWSGLKGAVPILLAALALLQGVDHAQQIYEIVFVVVAFSVIVQGSLVPSMARWLHVPMRMSDLEPWHISMRLPREPSGVRRFTVASGSRAAAERIEDLPLSERAWIVMLVRDGEPVRAGGSTELVPGDEVLVITGGHDADVLRRLFERQSS
jgi:cell volume regulation protein A